MHRRTVCTCPHTRPLRSARAAFDALDALDAFDAFDAFDDLDAFDGFDAFDDGNRFMRILRVLRHGTRTSPDGSPALSAGGRMSQRGALRRLMSGKPGVFLEGATASGARSWANRIANRLGAQVVYDAPHGPNARPHFHLEFPGGRRSGHIFYGRRAPSGDFFESGD